jgi:hypothetical protein
MTYNEAMDTRTGKHSLGSERHKRIDRSLRDEALKLDDALNYSSMFDVFGRTKRAAEESLYELKDHYGGEGEDVFTKSEDDSSRKIGFLAMERKNGVATVTHIRAKGMDPDIISQLLGQAIHRAHDKSVHEVSVAVAAEQANTIAALKKLDFYATEDSEGKRVYKKHLH